MSDYFAEKLGYTPVEYYQDFVLPRVYNIEQSEESI